MTEFFHFGTKNLSWKVIGRFRRAKSGTSWLRRNRVSEPWTWPTKSHWKDRELQRPWLQNSSCLVFMPRMQSFPIFSMWFGTGSCSGLRRSISLQPRRFRLCRLGFPYNFSRQNFWYQIKRIRSSLHTAYWKIHSLNCIQHITKNLHVFSRWNEFIPPVLNWRNDLNHWNNYLIY